MPLYGMRCRECGAEQEVFCAFEDRDDEVCEECEGELTHVVPGVATVGPTFSKPINYDQVGLSFDSKRDADAYTAQTGNRPATEAEWRKVTDMVRERADSAAQRQGFRDVEHRNAVHDTKTEKQHFVVGD